MSYGITMRSLSVSLVIAITVLFQPFVHAQVQPMPLTLPVPDPINNWDYASARTRTGAKVFVITIAQPAHHTACRVRSMANDQLVCRGPFGKTKIYDLQQIAALILPGDDALRLRLFIGFNAALGAATWGTYVLAPICIPCAVGTGVAALFFFSAAGVMSYADGQSASLIYRAPTENPTTQMVISSSSRTCPQTDWALNAAITARYIQDSFSPALAEQFRRDLFARQATIAGKDDLVRFTAAWFAANNRSLPFVMDASGACRQEVLSDRALGQRLGVPHTPCVFVVTRTGWTEIVDIDQLDRTIESALADSRKRAA